MYVQPSKHWRIKEHEHEFFRQGRRTPTDSESLADDEPLDEPKPIPAISKPVEHRIQSKQPVKTTTKGGTRRGYGRQNRRKENNGIKGVEFSILGTNSNGIQAKKESLLKNINTFQPSVITIQETKLRKTGILKLHGYQVFEKVRSGLGGGLLTAVDEKLLPVLISTGKKDASEILVVQVKSENHSIRIINAYGPQEDTYNKDDIFEF